MDARQRFLDKREMTLLFGQEVANQSNLTMSGNEGYITALEDRGLVTLACSETTVITDLDDLITEFDAGFAPEYAIYANTGRTSSTTWSLRAVVLQGWYRWCYCPTVRSRTHLTWLYSSDSLHSLAVDTRSTSTAGSC